MIIIISEDKETEIEKTITDIKSEIDNIDELRGKYINELNELRDKYYKNIVTVLENVKQKLNEKKVD